MHQWGGPLSLRCAAGNAWLLCIAVLMSLRMVSASEVEEADSLEFFERRIRPVLVEHCYECHSKQAAANNKLKGGLYVDSHEGLLRGGDSGPAVVPGDVDESLLIGALKYEAFEMPPQGPLSHKIVDDFSEWIRKGATDPRRDDSKSLAQRPAVDESQPHWSYLPPSRPSLPRRTDAESASLAPIDRLIEQRLQAEGLEVVGPAPREVLIRRLYFDLIGLPPHPEEIEAFVADATPRAYERLVDRLLAAPQFGERWGRHWLDVARYAESLTLRGFVLPEAWRYRDYVIRSFNDDRPFDLFVRQQLAGDLLPSTTLSDAQDQLIATTYLVLGNTNLEDQDKQQLDWDLIDEQLDTIGKGLLAQTIGCARCHDHKFDPIPTVDYYALAGILQNTQALEHANVSAWIERPLPLASEDEARFLAHEQAVSRLQRQIKEEKDALQRLERAGETSANRSGDISDASRRMDEYRGRIQTLEAELKDLVAQGPKRPMVMSVHEREPITETHVRIRGNVHQLGEPVSRGYLSVLDHARESSMPSHESGRRELAAWITSPQNPLTARVFVNRMWHWLFGAGIVRSTDNFGSTGERPSHPELLDYLAVRLIEQEWSVKAMVREVVMSRAYRLASADMPSNQLKDPENRLLWRMNRKRLDAECLVDAILTVSDELTLEVGGPTFAAGLSSDYGYVHRAHCRAVYWPAFRNSMAEPLATFDPANPSMVTGRRNRSTVAQQSLFLMNDPWILARAERAVDALIRDEPASNQARIELAFRRTLGRRPTTDELALSLSFVGKDSSSSDIHWAQFVQSLMASIDFRYLD